MKVRYWIDFGSREEFIVKWDCAMNNIGTINQRLIRVARLDDSVESLLFAVTCIETNCKTVVQGNHKDLWVENEFPILKKKLIIYPKFTKSAGLDLDLSDDDLVLSEDEDGHAEHEQDAAAVACEQGKGRGEKGEKERDKERVRVRFCKNITNLRAVHRLQLQRWAEKLLQKGNLLGPCKSNSVTTVILNLIQNSMVGLQRRSKNQVRRKQKGKSHQIGWEDLLASFLRNV